VCAAPVERDVDRAAHQHSEMQASHRTTVAVSALAEVNVPYTLTPYSDDYGEIATISVGSEAEKKDFYIHAGLLVHYSSYFRKALDSAWIEGRTKSITLSEDSPTIFQIFFHWIYTGELYSVVLDGAIPISFQDIFALYVFADARCIPELCDAAVDVFFRKFANVWYLPTDCLAYIYDNTLEGSNLRNIFVSLAVSTFNFCHIENHEEQYPKQFLIDVILRSYKLKTVPGNFISKKAFLTEMATQLCTYHDHKCPHDLDKTRSS
jgi:hypothetical protein